jgi:hypothetical protein
MVRAMSWLLSFWLAGLYVVGRGAAQVPQSFVWLTLLGALIAFIGGCIAPMMSLRAQVIGPLSLAIGLFALFAIGLAANIAPWLPWCTFTGAFTYTVVVLGNALWSPHFVRRERPRPV